MIPNQPEAPLYVGEVSEHAVIFNNFGKLLLFQHNGGGRGPANPRPHSTHYGKWYFPGGLLNANDQPVKAVLREIEGETGLRSVNIVMPCHTSRWGFDDPIKYSVAYLATVGGSPLIRLPDNKHAMAYEWFAPAETTNLALLTPTHKEVLAAAIHWAKHLGLTNG